MSTSVFMRYKIPLAFLVIFLVLIIPSLVRWQYFQYPGIVGFPTYFHQRIAGDIISGDFSWYDSLSFGGRPYTYPPAFVFTLAAFGAAFGLEAGGVIMAALFGAAAAVLLYLIARELLPDSQDMFLLLLVPIPLFIYLFAHLSTRSPPVTLGLLALYLVIRKRHWMLSAVPLGLSFLYSPEAGVFFWLTILFYSVWKKPAGFRFWIPGRKRDTEVLGVLALSAIIALAWYVPFFMQHGFLQLNALHEDYAARSYGMESFSLDKYFWETGYKGLPVVVYLLALVGVLKTEDRFLRVWFIFSLLIPLLLWRLFMYVLLPTSLLAGFGLYYLYRKKHRYRKPLLALLVVYMVFAAGFFTLSFSSGYPKPSQTEALLWMKANTPEDSLVLCDWPDGHWVAGIAERKAFIDGYAEYAPDADQRVEELNLFLDDCTVPYGVDYVFLEWWMIEKEGLDCVYRFEEIYNKSGMHIFKV